MGQFAPDFVFTDPTLASQLVRLSDLNAAHKNEQQQMAMAAMARQQALAAHQQQQQNQLGYQYAALANQQRAQDLADKRAAAELASRENMFGQQMGLSREGLQLQRELGLANPYGKAAGDILLGGMQTNNQIGQNNADAETEANNLTAALNGRYEKFVRDYNGVPDEVSGFRSLAGSVGGIFPHGWIPGVDTTADAITHRRESIRDQYLQDRNALISSAKHSSFDPASGRFVPVQRSPITMPGMGRLNGAQQAPPAGSGVTPAEAAPTPVTETPVVPQAGSFYQNLWGGAPQNQLQLGGPSLSPYPITPGAGVIGGGGNGLDRLNQQYLNGDISAQEYLQQFDGLNQ